jgi:hypothetical protein
VELKAFISSFFRYNKVEVAFVNSIGVVNRGDLVQLLFGKVPVIVGHSTYSREIKEEFDLYGYTRVETPDDYEEIFIPSNSGTTFWIQKTQALQTLIMEMKKYAQRF